MKPLKYKLDPSFPDIKIVDEASSLIRNRGVVVYPTDTTYVYGVNAVDEFMVTHLYNLKGRDFSKPFHVVVSNLEMAIDYAEINQKARKLAERYLPGPLTLVLPKKKSLPDLLVGNLPTIGIRIPDNPICLMLAHKVGFPITNTTANISGGKNPYSIEEITISGSFEQVDLILDQGVLPYRLPSTIVDLSSEVPVILREGPIPGSEILDFIQK